MPGHESEPESDPDGGAETRRLDLGPETVDATPLWRADFAGADVDDDEWLVERQKPGSEVRFEEGRLRVDCIDERGVTVWTRRGFPADLVVEYTATCAEPDERLTSRNLNCFLAASDEDPLSETERSGAYPDYHVFDNYVFTLTRTHSRLRRDPGFEKVSELVMGIQPDEEYRVRLARRGDRVTACVNGRVLHDWTDDDPHGPGWVGLRTYDTDVTYDDWTVYRVE